MFFLIQSLLFYYRFYIDKVEHLKFFLLVISVIVE